MHRLITFIIFISIVYYILQPQYQEEMQTYNTKSAIDSSAQNTEEKKNLQAEYKQEPKSTAERVVTNVLSQVFSTEGGVKLVQNLITKEDAIKSTNISVSANNAGIARNVYKPFITTDSKQAKTICGQKICLEYSRESQDGKIEYSGSHTYKLGTSKSRDLNIIPDGMRLGQITRIYIMPVKMMDTSIAESEAKYSPYVYNIHIKEHLSHHALDTDKIKIFDDSISTAQWTSCGDNLRFVYTIKDIKGKILKSDELTVRVGDENYPEALAYSLAYMSYQGSRTIILPLAYLKTSSNPLIKEGDDEEYVFLEITKTQLIPDHIESK